uniref:Uncharacterized protein n=1 Tax=Arundo donax TaxID=35708 RepID=A0A0A8ZSV4_ARUDO
MFLKINAQADYSLLIYSIKIRPAFLVD